MIFLVCVRFDFECTGTGTWTRANFARTVERYFHLLRSYARLPLFSSYRVFFCNICQAKIKLPSLRESYFFVNELSQSRFERQKKKRKKDIKKTVNKKRWHHAKQQQQHQQKSKTLKLPIQVEEICVPWECERAG